MTENRNETSLKKNRSPMALVCGILFVTSSIAIFALGGDRSAASYVGMSILPLLFLVGAVHFWKAS